jgi:arylsulfatase A-like enzyme
MKIFKQTKSALLLLTALSGIVLCSFLSLKKTETANPRPNIIIIMADDMGFSDIGCYGSEISTPNIDKLAVNGIKLRSFYNAGRCCPTRASLLTGNYSHAVGMGGMVSFEDEKVEKGSYQGYLDPSVPTIAERLHAAGYNTYMTGKWHVGERPEHWPLKRGFDKYFGLISGASSYFEVLKEKRKRFMVLNDQEYVLPTEGYYATDAFTNKAIEFINQADKKANPFFLYLAYTAPHFPLHAYEEDIAKYEKFYLQGWDVTRENRFKKMQKLGLLDKRYALTTRPNNIPAWNSVQDKATWARKMAVYAAMIDRMDRNIGKLIKNLEDTKQLDNTFIVFLSDNGGCDENVDDRKLGLPTKRIGERGSYGTYDYQWANVSNTPFKLYKKFTHEGGIISPCIMHWPAKIKPKKGYMDAPSHVIDLLPTSLDLAQAPAATNIHGQSLSYLWTGKKANPRTLYWEHQGNEAIRTGNFKLVKEADEADWALYDLETDPSENKNIAQQSEKKVAEMSIDFDVWAKKVGVKQSKKKVKE